MSSISLQKVFKKQKLQPLLQKLIHELNSTIAIEATDGQALLSSEVSCSAQRYPIVLSEEIIGWAVGDPQAALIAELLSLVAKQELEKKELARELLERYQEIDLFEDISTQLTTSLDTRQIAQLVLQEMSRLIDSSAGVILLLNPEETGFEPIAQFGAAFDPDRLPGELAMIAQVVQAGRAELINHVQADPRCPGETMLQALICAPLKAKGRVLGAIALGTSMPDAYIAEHLKLAGIFASQTAVAIEKALLYEQSCAAAIQAKAQAQQLQQALQDLQLAQTQLIQSEKMSSLGQLIAGVAHEINNPVNFICGNLKYVAEYAQDVLRLLERYQQYFPTVPPDLEAELEEVDLEFLSQDLPKLLNSMKLGTDRIVEIVQSLKNFSRHDEAEMKVVNIHDGLDGTLMILHHRLKPTGYGAAITVIKDYGTLPPIECYAGQLNQVFMNILANAIDALEEQLEEAPESNLHPSITIRTEACDGWAVIRIADNGPGMSEAVLQRMYDPFFTTKAVGKGTGLGMAISHQIIVDKHRGQLRCRSHPGQGTEFWIQIPLDITAAAIASAVPAVLAMASGGARAIAPGPTAPESNCRRDAEEFVIVNPPVLQPSDLLLRHTQLIQRWAQQESDSMMTAPEQIYQLFQRHPITLKLYTALLSQFYCSLPSHPTP